jgi:hypothetical protein
VQNKKASIQATDAYKKFGGGNDIPLVAATNRNLVKEANMLKTPKAIKRDILSKFRSQLDDRDTIPSKWLKEDYLKLLSSQEKTHFNRAVSDLVEKGLIEKVNSCIHSLRITDKGASLIS